MPKKILFITPRFGKSGSESYLHSLISRLNNEDFKISLLSIQQGELLGTLSDITEYSLEYYYKRQRRFINSLINKFRREDLEIKFFKKVVKRENPDVIYINTLVIPRYFELVAQTGIKFVVHSHELEQAIFHNATQNDYLINSPELIIGCSPSNKRVLEILGRTKPIVILSPAIDLMKIKITTSQLELRETLGIPEDAYIWVMSGSTDSNKDPALFVELASEIIKKKPNTYFIWIGGSQNFGTGLYAKKYSQFLKLDKHVLWFNHIISSDYYNYLNLADSFVLTSRRDSFPLVMIENAALGKPIVAFNSGGVKQFVNNPEIGVVVNEYSKDKMLEAMLYVMDNMIDYKPAVCKLRAQDFDIKSHVIRWTQIINSIV